MNSVTIIGFLAVASLLVGCRSTPTPQTTTPQIASTQSDTPQLATPQSPIAIVRDGYLKSNRTTTIGQALTGTFKDGKWKSFTSEKGVTVVEFDGTEPFSVAYSQSISEKIEAECKAEAAKTASSKEQTEGEQIAEHFTCVKAAETQHADDPVPIEVQFTLNHDGTFQYYSNNMGLSSGELFQKIYN